RKYYNLDSNSPLLREYQKKSLDILIQQAVQNTAYYKEYESSSDISDFPVINKSIISAQQTDFLSNKFNKEELIQMSTSGSTGTPFTSYQNKSKKRRVNAETIFFNEKAGYKVGSKFVYLRSLNSKNKKTKLKQWIENQKIVDIDKMNDKSIEELFHKIKMFTSDKSATMLSYASTYDILRDYFKKNGFSAVENCNIHGIISTSEILFDETRRYMSEAFGSACYSRYANMEN